MPKKEYWPLRYAVPVAGHTVGAICEVQVSADLMKRGYEVYRTMSHHASCDLVALRNDKLVRIEVRAAKKGQCGTHGVYDCLAAVDPDGTIYYRPDIDALTAST